MMDTNEEEEEESINKQQKPKGKQQNKMMSRGWQNYSQKKKERQGQKPKYNKIE